MTKKVVPLAPKRYSIPLLDDAGPKKLSFWERLRNRFKRKGWKGPTRRTYSIQLTEDPGE